MNTISLQSELAKLITLDHVHVNLPISSLIEKSIMRGEGKLSSTGALTVETGAYTGRSPKDKFIVKEPSVENVIEWGTVNQPIEKCVFTSLYHKVMEHLSLQDELFVSDGYAGADQKYQIPLKVINEFAWHQVFARQLFIRPTEEQEPIQSSGHDAFTVISAPTFKADPILDGTNSEAFVLISFEERVVLIGGTEYAGEMKKSIFSIMNFLLPEQDVLSMHCSANTGNEGDVALFFGLSGTGKTTLSADPHRSLIGDDEHGWSNNGVFNIEGGCYAKCIHLSEEKEPQIWDAIRFGAVLENVVVHPHTGKADYDDTSLTENTRAAYPLESIPNALVPSVAGHPNTIIFLTADAFGVLPPISKLTKEQAMYHFLSGYTSKLAGTERGITSPEATFSTCFGAPFLPLPAIRYAEMLGDKIDQHNVDVYLVNTGWSGGEYGVGERMKLKYTRAMVQAALTGELSSTETITDSIFGLHSPAHCPGVPDHVLQPRETWQDKKAYDAKAKELAENFKKNFQKFNSINDRIKEAGPK
ncbi:phosphoenolpyruvate carboxykinase (ATP) [Alkalihalobacillus sp. MEB130]|uniref:phosphoenolpyruvate carboxykinase (ATP) n=1 Tax=Alkalihalobacillus sp. MEB130 TaxID=2976704 RepID=UPI0028E08FBF|nr:phosphoenolpyruvate carboxykinase (ATP) [Alkalihalobacillus sp. MEB130]MDT8859313.1 phosphoenolpyruvate carboxykinase (ATP) [Alkalihalobacillus sp. MEB130]